MLAHFSNCIKDWIFPFPWTMLMHFLQELKPWAQIFFPSETAFHLAKIKHVIHSSSEDSRPRSTSSLHWLTFLQGKSDLHDSAALRFIMQREDRFESSIKEHKEKLSWNLFLVTVVKNQPQPTGSFNWYLIGETVFSCHPCITEAKNNFREKLLKKLLGKKRDFPVIWKMKSSRI